MRVFGLVVLGLAGCAAQPDAAGPDRSVLVAACQVAVAAHVGKARDAVTAEWSGTTPAGMGLVTVSDAQGAGAERVHTCEVTADLRIVEVLHPE